MKCIYVISGVIIMAVFPLLANENKPSFQKHELRMSLNDVFVVRETDEWKVTVVRSLRFRFADVLIEPRNNASFSMMLFFHCDTPNLAHYDTAEKMEHAVRTSSMQYLPEATETTIELKKFDINGRYGFYTVLTDKKLEKVEDVPEDEWRYLTRGMLRISDDSALGFSLMTNEIDGDQYNKLIDYIKSFVRPNQKSNNPSEATR